VRGRTFKCAAASAAVSHSVITVAKFADGWTESGLLLRDPRD